MRRCVMELGTSANVDIFKFLSQEKLEATETETKWKKCSDFVLLTMLEEGIHADITLKARKGSVKAHRCVLACMSPVFRAMFQHNMKEQLTSTVNLLDMTIDALQFFLLLLYTPNELDFYRCAQEMPQFRSAIEKHFDELLTALHKYQVRSSGVISVLESALLGHLTPENCWHCYNCIKLSLLHAKPPSEFIDLRKVTVSYIVGNYDQVIKSESFLVEMKRDPGRIQKLAIQAESRDTRELCLGFLQVWKKRRTGWTEKMSCQEALYEWWVQYLVSYMNGGSNFVQKVEA